MSVILNPPDIDRICKLSTDIINFVTNCFEMLFVEVGNVNEVIHFKTVN